MTVKTGTCGFRINKKEYAKILSCVEIQHTFYQPPQIDTLKSWRDQVPDDFEFSIKVWQLITHAAKSPTYRRLRQKLTEEQKMESGYFKPAPLVRNAWKTMLACADALRAKTVLFQCPASFKPSAENISNLEIFFTEVERNQLNFCWEPRGSAWDDGLVQDICKRLDLWHVVDPFVKKTTTPDKCYYRLHGRTGWRYKYEEDEALDLAEILPVNPTRPAYVFFNNRYMLEDAVRFQEIIHKPRV